MKLEPVVCMPGAWSSVHAMLVVHLFEGHLSLTDMERMHEQGVRWNAAHPGRRVELAVIFPSDARMSHEERARMARLIKRDEQLRAASATVILAEGLGAAMQRSVLTGLMMLAPAPHPAKVFGRLDEALRWLTPHVQAVAAPTLDGERLARLVAENVAAFRARELKPEAANRP